MGPIDFVGFYACFHADRLAVMEMQSGRRWNYRQLDIAIARCAGALRREFAVSLGDRVASLARNRAELLILHLACSRLGAIYAPLNWRLAASELQLLVNDIEPALLVGDTALDRAGLQGVSIDAIAQLISSSDPLPCERIDPNRPALMLFTSGTSGRPKGAVLSERNLAQLGLNSGYFSRVTHESRYLIDSPMFHLIGISTCVRPPLMHGGGVCISDGFDAATTLARLSDSDLAISHYFCVPQMSTMLRRHKDYDPNRLRRLTALFTGGAPHPEAEMLAWLDDDIPVVNQYGMSEAGSVFSMPIDIERIRARPRSVGIGTPDIAARIVDEELKECPPGTAGELLLKGDNIFLGYWRLPELNQSYLTHDGWFRTGDVAIWQDGYYTLVDRKKDMFISGGENVYPAEIESAISAFPGLAEVAVVGVPDERWGEVGHLVIVPCIGTEISAAAVLGFLETRIARYKLPKHLTLMAELPRTTSGKVQKQVLRATLLDNPKHAPADLES